MRALDAGLVEHLQRVARPSRAPCTGPAGLSRLADAAVVERRARGSARASRRARRLPAPARVAEALDQQQRRARRPATPTRSSPLHRLLQSAAACAARRIRPSRARPPGTKKTTRMKSTPRTKSGCCSGVRSTDGSDETACEPASVAEPVVERTCRATPPSSAPQRDAGAADHDHHEQRQREVRRRHRRASRRRAAAGRRRRRRSRGTTRARTTSACTRYGRSPSTSTRSSFSRIACQTWPGRRVDRPAHDHEDDGGVAEREPVEVLRVEDADEAVGQLRVVGAEALPRRRSACAGS